MDRPAAARDRLRDKLRTRKAAKGESIIEHHHDKDQDEIDESGGIAPEDVATHPKFIKATFDVTVHLLDHDALLRNGATKEGVELYETLRQDCRLLSDSPTWHLTVPALSRDVSIGKPAKQSHMVSCVDVMLKNTTALPDHQRLPSSEDAPALDHLINYVPLSREKGEKVYAVKTCVWTVDDPNKEHREATHHPTTPPPPSETTPPPPPTHESKGVLGVDNEEKKKEHDGKESSKSYENASNGLDYVPKYSSTPFSLECSMDSFSEKKPCHVGERFTTDNDPAALATSWTWAEGEREFDLEGHIPVRATAVACELLNPTLLSNRGATELLTRKKNRRPYYVEQKGVAICRAKHVLGRRATLPEELVAVIHERHCIAHAILRAPSRTAAKRLISMALGSLTAGTMQRDGKEQLACALLSQMRVLVVPYDIYVECMKNLRKDALTNLDQMVPMGKLELRLAKADDNGQQRRINVVTTYVKFESCPSLLLRRGASYVGDGWLSMVLSIGSKKIVGNSDAWDKRVGELQEFCASLLKDQDLDRLDIDEETGVVNMDSLSDLLEERLKSAA